LTATPFSEGVLTLFFFLFRDIDFSIDLAIACVRAFAEASSASISASPAAREAAFAAADAKAAFARTFEALNFAFPGVNFRSDFLLDPTAARRMSAGVLPLLLLALLSSAVETSL
jgi:hypothetical protein